jgi:glycosyltransferase involved in cell wall biosynthesis
MIFNRREHAAAVKHLIVIPAYNEQDALPQTLASLAELPPEFEVVIINDGSRDRTGAVSEEQAKQASRPVHVLHLPMNGGIGVAVQTGYLFAQKAGRFEFVIQFDADGQHGAAAVPALVAACRQNGWDLGIGSRFLEPYPGGFQSTFSRRIGIRFFGRLIRWLTGQRITDPTSGLRCAGPRVWQRFARHYPEDYPEPESLFWCLRNGMKVGEVAVRMNARQGGASSIRWRQSIYYMVKVTTAILIESLRPRGN